MSIALGDKIFARYSDHLAFWWRLLKNRSTDWTIEARMIVMAAGSEPSTDACNQGRGRLCICCGPKRHSDRVVTFCLKHPIYVLPKFHRRILKPRPRCHFLACDGHLLCPRARCHFCLGSVRYVEHTAMGVGRALLYTLAAVVRRYRGEIPYYQREPHTF